MNFYDVIYMMSLKQPNKAAFIIDDMVTTYKELIEKVDSCDIHRLENVRLSKESTIDKDHSDKPVMDRRFIKEVLYIQSTSVLQDFIVWLQALKIGYVPVLVHKELPVSDTKILDAYRPNKESNFGVLSSGTTGMPKIFFRRTHSWVDFFDIQNEVFKISVNTRLFFHGSLSFTGNLNAVLSVLYVGGTVVTITSLRRHRIIKLYKEELITHVYLLPTKLRMITSMMKEPNTSVQMIFTGSQMIDNILIESIEKNFPHSDFIMYYGASELNFITYCTKEEWKTHPNTVGKPWKNVSISTQDGFIEVDTPYGIEGINRPFRTTDKGYITVDGFLQFEGRETDSINKGGYKIWIPTIEEKLRLIEGVQDVVVIGVCDDIRGEDLGVVLTAIEGYEEHQIIEEIRQVLLKVEQPKIIKFLKQLPMKDSSKIDVIAVREYLLGKE